MLYRVWSDGVGLFMNYGERNQLNAISANRKLKRENIVIVKPKTKNKYEYKFYELD